VNDDTLLTLKDACEIYFGGKVTPATLKAEHKEGNLALFKIGRAWFTTPTEIRTMREKCRVEIQAQGSGPTRGAIPGQSSTAAPDIAQDAALMTLKGLKKHFAITSRGSTSRLPVKRRLLRT
jgi:hypothetical protein